MGGRWFGTFLTLLLVLGLAPASLAAADKQPKKPKDETPRIVTVLPPGVVAGEQMTLRVRGLNLKSVDRARLLGREEELMVGKKRDEKPYSKYDKEEMGDTSVEITLRLPAQPGTNAVQFLVRGKDGKWSGPFALTVFAEAKTEREERGSNGGFATAEPVAVPVVLRGSISKRFDVDVFRLELPAGRTLVGEVIANRHGSPFDPGLTLYDADGNQVIADDDSGPGRDSLIRFPVKSAGVHYLAVNDVNDNGGSVHEYFLKLRFE